MLCPSVPGRCLHCFPSILLSSKEVDEKECLIPLLPLSHNKNLWFSLREHQAREVKLHCFGSWTLVDIRLWSRWCVSWIFLTFLCRAPLAVASPLPIIVPIDPHYHLDCFHYLCFLRLFPPNSHTSSLSYHSHWCDKGIRIQKNNNCDNFEAPVGHH